MFMGLNKCHNDDEGESSSAYRSPTARNWSSSIANRIIFLQVSFRRRIVKKYHFQVICVLVKVDKRSIKMSPTRIGPV